MYKCSNHDSNKFIILLQKDVHPFEYMDGWDKFNEASLPEKGDFYGHLNMEDINDADYTQPKIVYKDFETKHSGECHDFYVQMIHYC